MGPFLRGGSTPLNIKLPSDETLLLDEPEDFVAPARAAGADKQTPVDEITHDQDPSLRLGLPVTAASVGHNVVRTVPVPLHLAMEPHHLLEQIARGDGDARGLPSGVSVLDTDLWHALTKQGSE